MLFWVITQWVVVISYRCFGTTYRSCPQGSRITQIKSQIMFSGSWDLRVMVVNILWSRNCGKIFCADCSENTVPLPNEQLYDPVRVCTNCFSLLHNASSLLKRQHVNGTGNTNGFVMDVDPLNPLPLISGGMDSCKQQGTDVKCPKPVVTAASTWISLQYWLFCWRAAW